MFFEFFLNEVAIRVLILDFEEMRKLNFFSDFSPCTVIVEGPFPTSFGVQMAILCPDGVEKMSCGVSYNFFGPLMMLAFPIFGFHLPTPAVFIL